MPVSKIKSFVSRHLHHLMQIRDTPHAIAGGVGIGIICGFTPFFGFKTLAGFLIAWLFRCSKLAAVLSVTFHDILIPIWPVLLRWQYIIGYWVLHHQLPARMTRDKFILSNWFQWKTLHIVWPLLIGSLIMAVPLALVVYFVCLKIVARYQAIRESQIPHS